MPSSWQCVLALDSDRSIKADSPEALAAAIRRGADLRVGTDFRHNEHVDPGSGDTQLIREVSDFRTTYLLDDRWVAAVMSLRMPVVALDGWGPGASMSFFMYNQNGQQAIARPYLDGLAPPDDADASPGDDPDMPKMHVQENCDVDTNAPAQHFIYDFDEYRY